MISAILFGMSDHGQLHVVSGAKGDVPHDVNIHLAFTAASLPDFMKHLDQLGVKYGNLPVNRTKSQFVRMYNRSICRSGWLLDQVNNDRF
jgi:hypothetical protein